MRFRRRRFKTADLASLVHPTPLLEALKALVDQGELEWYEYGRYRCTIKLTKSSGLSMILKEASIPVANPRPYIANKAHNGKLRKTKS